MPRCTRCFLDLPAAEFGTNRATKLGISCLCRACAARIARERRAATSGGAVGAAARLVARRRHALARARAAVVVAAADVQDAERALTLAEAAVAESWRGQDAAARAERQAAPATPATPATPTDFI